jgi:hypothetical protein
MTTNANSAAGADLLSSEICVSTSPAGANQMPRYGAEPNRPPANCKAQAGGHCVTRRTVMNVIASTAAVAAVPIASPGTASSQDVILVAAAKELDVCDDEIESLHSLYDDEAIDREEYQVWDGRRDRSIATLINEPATSLLGLRAKATAMQMPTVSDSYEDHGGIGQSLAEDILGDTLAEFQAVLGDDAKLIDLARRIAEVKPEEYGIGAENKRCAEVYHPILRDVGHEEAYERSGLRAAEARAVEVSNQIMGLYAQAIKLIPTGLAGYRALARATMLAFYGDKIIPGDTKDWDGIAVILSALTGAPVDRRKLAS